MKFYNARNSFMDEERFAPLFINGCGISQDVSLSQGARGICRPNGREDYQLIYVISGYMTAKFVGNKQTVIPKGTLILYKPQEPQIYSYPKDDFCSFFWIHFGGETADELLRACGLYKKNCYYLPECENALRIIEQIGSEITHKLPSYQLRLMGLFCHLLTTLSRTGAYGEVNKLFIKLSPALKEIESRPHICHSIDEYANMCHMSKYHFIREFKKFKGSSPIQYRNTLCMTHAAELLESTDMSISEISVAIGIDNPLYFSKKFKDFYGHSPICYRHMTALKK
ncbi:MAG: helix-turn-helix domain-containing protein [Ruminococcaceae bacterium]|nr:helix-turn-helix domain-containing protein [Oscillospiraceae bacterium]